MDYHQLEQRINSFTDHEIRKALFMRDDYEPMAVEILIQVAKDRGIIEQEDDIDRMDPLEFGRNKKFGVFSPITNHETLHRLVGSMHRIMFIFTAIPLIYGGQLIMKKDYFLGVISVIAAIVWLGCILSHKKNGNKKTVQFLRIFSVLLGTTLVCHWIYTTPNEPMNILVAVLTFLFPVLSAHYLYKLSTQEEENTITK
ncbi:hypothetical protein K5X82_03370 [Halosquirtibacter xylanolyticus]|uniref:hypothetical protein n=1 Tax=Halosquirtibacter xylanolyticus TaxID=3374599 RepID=UPI00374A75E8|nr:hypothetical protein K5X82_03370 [Prolixibacteraceae bacterium]